MQEAPVLKGSGLQPLKETTEEVHVFGRNLEDRVVTNNEEEEEQQQQNQQQQPQSSDLNSQQPEGDVDIKKRKFEAITGEEEEETIFQGDFKLYGWDLASSNWIEKGRGQLKLNDSLAQDCPESRLIMRISGTLRIVLNVAIRKGFRIISSSKTNLRFTDGQNMWAVSGGTADILAEVIEPRIEIVKQLNKAEDEEADEDAKSVKKTKKDGERNDSCENDSNKVEQNIKQDGSTTDQPVAPTGGADTDKPSSQKEDQQEKQNSDSQEKGPESPQHHTQPEQSEKNSAAKNEESSRRESNSEIVTPDEPKAREAGHQQADDKNNRNENAQKEETNTDK